MPNQNSDLLETLTDLHTAVRAAERLCASNASALPEVPIKKIIARLENIIAPPFRGHGEVCLQISSPTAGAAGLISALQEEN